MDKNKQIDDTLDQQQLLGKVMLDSCTNTHWGKLVSYVGNVDSYVASYTLSKAAKRGKLLKSVFQDLLSSIRTSQQMSAPAPR